MFIEIDNGSGFCNGVTTAIRKAEEELSASSTPLYCLGDIVHNGRECERLKALGLISVDKASLSQLHDTKLLLRAHGEPPSTYRQAEEQNIEIIDATCPVVLHIQKRIKADYDADPEHKKQIVKQSGVVDLIDKNVMHRLLEERNDLEMEYRLTDPKLNFHPETLLPFLIKQGLIEE